MTTPNEQQLELTLRGKAIAEDAHGRICLNDIWEASGAGISKEPKHWRGNKGAIELIDELQKKVTAGYLKEGRENVLVIEAQRGRGARGTFAHPVLAAAYAGYLNPKLEIEVREVWLRFRAGDVKLADEIMDRADKADNEWMAKRSISRATRLGYTDALKDHGVQDSRGYADCTNATYRGLFGRTAGQLKLERGVKKNGSLRDAMDLKELATVSFAEVLSTDRMADENSRGTIECYAATSKVAGAVRKLIDADLADRQRRMLG
jgi:hypothetical protein